MHGTVLSWKREWFITNGHYSMFTEVVNSSCSGRSICRRKCLTGKELRSGRLFACRPSAETENSQNVAASAYATRSWKIPHDRRGGGENSGARKNFPRRRETRVPWGTREKFSARSCGPKMWLSEKYFRDLPTAPQPPSAAARLVRNRVFWARKRFLWPTS
jgi:hypothetical protein